MRARGVAQVLKEVKALGEAIRLSEAPCSAGDWPAAGSKPRALSGLPGPRSSQAPQGSASAFVDRESETGKSSGQLPVCQCSVPLGKRVKRQKSILGGGEGQSRAEGDAKKCRKGNVRPYLRFIHLPVEFEFRRMIYPFFRVSLFFCFKGQKMESNERTPAMRPAAERERGRATAGEKWP